MAKYTVVINEYMSRAFNVEADSQEEAEQIADWAYCKGYIQLDYNDCYGWDMESHIYDEDFDKYNETIEPNNNFYAYKRKNGWE